MSKSSKFVTTVLLGVAGGAAAAVFLASKSGQVIKEKVTNYLKDYQEDPEAKQAEWADKANELKSQAVDKYTDVRQKFETGELTPEDIVETVKGKATELKDRVTQEDFFASLKEQASKLKEEVVVLEEEEFAEAEPFDAESISEDITIDLNEVDLLADEVIEPDPNVLDDKESQV